MFWMVIILMRLPELKADAWNLEGGDSRKECWSLNRYAYMNHLFQRICICESLTQWIPIWNHVPNNLLYKTRNHEMRIPVGRNN